MVEAMRSQELAVRQQLANVYRGQLRATRDRLLEFVAGKLRALDQLPAAPPALRFENIVRGRIADSCVVYDDSGAVVYPHVPRRLVPVTFDSETFWKEAQRLEFEEVDLTGAAAVYGQLMAETEDRLPAGRGVAGADPLPSALRSTGGGSGGRRECGPGS